MGPFLFPPSIISLLMRENLGGGALASTALSKLSLYLLHIVLQASVDSRSRRWWVFQVPLARGRARP